MGSVRSIKDRCPNDSLARSGGTTSAADLQPKVSAAKTPVKRRFFLIFGKILLKGP